MKEEKNGLEEIKTISSTTTSVIGTLTVGITTGDQWFAQLPVVALQSQVTGPKIRLWVHHIQAVLWPRKLLQKLAKNALSKKISTE